MRRHDHRSCSRTQRRGAWGRERPRVLQLRGAAAGAGYAKAGGDRRAGARAKAAAGASAGEGRDGSWCRRRLWHRRRRVMVRLRTAGWHRGGHARAPAAGPKEASDRRSVRQLHAAGDSAASARRARGQRRVRHSRVAGRCNHWPAQWRRGRAAARDAVCACDPGGASRRTEHAIRRRRSERGGTGAGRAGERARRSERSRCRHHAAHGSCTRSYCAASGRRRRVAARRRLVRVRARSAGSGRLEL